MKLQKCEAPALTGATRDSLERTSRKTSSLASYRVQFLIAAHNVRPEFAAMIAAIAFGGGACYG